MRFGFCLSINDAHHCESFDIYIVVEIGGPTVESICQIVLHTNIKIETRNVLDNEGENQ